MQLLRFQTAVFFNVPAERPDLLSGNMSSDLLTLFDQIPITNPAPPLPQGIPDVPDFPIVTLMSSRPGFQGTISRSRADLFYSYASKRNYSDLLPEILYYSHIFVKYFCSKQQANRVGIVMSAFIPDENAVKAITKKYISSDLQNSEELAIRFNKREQVDGLQLNSIVNVRSDDVSFDQQPPVSGIVIERDINNIVCSMQLTDSQCDSICNYAFKRYAEEDVKELIL